MNYYISYTEQSYI